MSFSRTSLIGLLCMASCFAGSAIAKDASTQPAAESLDKLSVPELRDELFSAGLDVNARRAALVELGKRAGRPAIKVLEAFDESLRTRAHQPTKLTALAPLANSRTTALTIRISAECSDAAGQRWCAGTWYSMGYNRLWLCKLGDGFEITAAYPIPLPVASNPAALQSILGAKRIQLRAGSTPGNFELQLAETAFSFTLADIAKDSDNDGFCDGFEQCIGADPARADSDGDGKSDSADTFPLAPPLVQPGDRHEVMQAVFTYLAGFDESIYFLSVYTANEAPAEFFGPSGIVCERIEPSFSMEIKSQTSDTALVESSYSNSDCWHRMEFELKRAHGKWVIVGVTDKGTVCA